MQRRLRIIMDYEHRIEPDAETNWVTIRVVPIEFSVTHAINANRDTLVLRP